MSKMAEIKNLTDEEILEICDTYSSASEYIRSIGISGNGRYTAVINQRRISLGLEWQEPKNKRRNKDCPVCGSSFKPDRLTQVTCSHSCANTYFRSGKNNPNYKTDKKDYRSTCFEIRKKECIICQEANIVEVHHFDENHDNNDINLSLIHI